MNRLFTATLVAAAAVALLFLTLPLAALFLHVGPGRLLASLGGRSRATRCSSA